MAQTACLLARLLYKFSIYTVGMNTIFHYQDFVLNVSVRHISPVAYVQSHGKLNTVHENGNVIWRGYGGNSPLCLTHGFIMKVAQAQVAHTMFPAL